jgi:uncharacterized protein (TIGR02996 family)
MKPREAFHEHILAHPDDGAAKLMFMDWLQEFGETEEDRMHGEFGAVQYFTEGYPAGEVPAKLQRREQQLMRLCRKRILGNLPQKRRAHDMLSPQYSFARGMLTSATMFGRHFESRAPELFSHPLRDLTIMNPHQSDTEDAHWESMEPRILEVLRSEYVGRLRSLLFHRYTLATTNIRDTIGRMHKRLQKLQCLGIRGASIHTHDLADVIQVRLPVPHLNLSHNLIGTRGLRNPTDRTNLFHSMEEVCRIHVTTLRTLNLQYNLLTHREACILRDSVSLADVRIDVSHNGGVGFLFRGGGTCMPAGGMNRGRHSFSMGEGMDGGCNPSNKG